MIVALICGEDSPSEVSERKLRHTKIWGIPRYFTMDGAESSFSDHLSSLELHPKLDLIIVDPVRKFLDGDEDSSSVVSAFYNRLENIARVKNSGVLVVHHLAKTRGQAKSLAQILPMVRGSGVHTDRPRLVIAIIDRGNGVVEIGPINSNLPADAMWLPVNQGQMYRRDPDTFTTSLIEVAGRMPVDDGGIGSAEQRVLAAIGEANAEGRVVRKSGKAGLFEGRVSELAGLSRGRVLDAIAVLIESGDVIDGSGGLQVVPRASGDDRSHGSHEDRKAS